MPCSIRNCNGRELLKGLPGKTQPARRAQWLQYLTNQATRLKHPRVCMLHFSNQQLAVVSGKSFLKHNAVLDRNLPRLTNVDEPLSPVVNVDEPLSPVVNVDEPLSSEVDGDEHPKSNSKCKKPYRRVRFPNISHVTGEIQCHRCEEVIAAARKLPRHILTKHELDYAAAKRANPKCASGYLSGQAHQLSKTRPKKASRVKEPVVTVICRATSAAPPQSGIVARAGTRRRIPRVLLNRLSIPTGPTGDTISTSAELGSVMVIPGGLGGATTGTTTTSTTTTSTTTSIACPTVSLAAAAKTTTARTAPVAPAEALPSPAVAATLAAVKPSSGPAAKPSSGTGGTGMPASGLLARLSAGPAAKARPHTAYVTTVMGTKTSRAVVAVPESTMTRVVIADSLAAARTVAASGATAAIQVCRPATQSSVTSNGVRQQVLAAPLRPELVTTTSSIACPPVGSAAAAHTAPVAPAEAGPVSAFVERQAQELTDMMRQGVETMLNKLSAADVSAATVAGLQLQIERVQWQHKTELAELVEQKKAADAQIAELKATVAQEQKKAKAEAEAMLSSTLAAESKTWERLLEQQVAETKKNQWCANCSKEANFYCCWNTSYCDFPCQGAQWPEHMLTCTNQQNNISSAAVAATLTRASRKRRKPLSAQLTYGVNRP